MPELGEGQTVQVEEVWSRLHNAGNLKKSTLNVRITGEHKEELLVTANKQLDNILSNVEFSSLDDGTKKEWINQKLSFNRGLTEEEKRHGKDNNLLPHGYGQSQ